MTHDVASENFVRALSFLASFCILQLITGPSTTMRDRPHPHLEPEDMGIEHPDAKEEDFMEHAVNLESK